MALVKVIGDDRLNLVKYVRETNKIVIVDNDLKGELQKLEPISRRRYRH